MKYRCLYGCNKGFIIRVTIHDEGRECLLSWNLNDFLFVYGFLEQNRHEFLNHDSIETSNLTKLKDFLHEK